MDKLVEKINDELEKKGSVVRIEKDIIDLDYSSVDYSSVDTYRIVVIDPYVVRDYQAVKFKKDLYEMILGMAKEQGIEIMFNNTGNTFWG